MSKEKIQVIERIGAAASPDQLFNMTADFKGARYFYMNKDRSEWLIGLGHAYIIKEESRSPEKISEAYQALLARVDGDHHVRLFGGFQFDDGTSELFEGFGHSHFIWPKIQILYRNNELLFSYTDMTEEEIDGWYHEHHADRPVIQTISNLDEEKFLNNVRMAVEAMDNQLFDKVVLSRQKKIVAENQIDSSWLIENGLKNLENSYLVLLEEGNKLFVSRTPEQLVKVENNQLSTNAIAGTMSRSIADAEKKLLADGKNLFEHQIVVNSITADIQDFTTGLKIPETPGILANNFFYHLYTPIEAIIEEGDILSVSDALHPTPALGGYPKEEAARFIERVEGDRGFYGAPMGYITPDMDGEFVVAIRSMLVEGNTAVLFAGCGVVKDSIPESELYETEIKFKPMLQLLGVSQ
ncbi:isochorismate synthase [Macrococcus hajekii]|uniref:isochorismate synthase n=1 Tax=Macrococcus hajekii TaxID=198482 RepID=A0A4R6BLE7_9STAP|nr:isochorismate synthase [Macrococcus hajekii]TDM02596.1 isochorismate synthase [Macrococcus hajekii]GGB02256.1 menaquinone-specific isochorismate synthase [Macrococcus hajekii]